MISKELSINMMFKNLKKFEQNIGVLADNSNESESKLRFPFSFIQIEDILGLLTNFNSKRNKTKIISILSVISNSKKFNEKKYQDLFMKVLEYFEDEEFKLLCN